MLRDAPEFVPVEFGPPFARAPQVASTLLGKAKIANEGPVLKRHPVSEPRAVTRGKLFL